MNLVEKAKSIIMNPKEVWAQIKNEPLSIKDIYSSYICILTAIPAVAHFIGWSVVGVSTPFMGHVRTPLATAFVYAVTSYVLSLVGLYAVALIANLLAPKFGSAKNITSAMKAAGFSWTPYWIAGVLYIIPPLAPLVFLASLYGLYLFYNGLPALMETPKEKALGYVVAVVLASIVAFLVLSVVSGVLITAGRAGRLF